MKGFAHLYYKRALLPYLLFPIALIYGFIIKCRRKLYSTNYLKSYRAKVPVIIVGNITLGGVGKTPLCIALIELLKEKGYKPGVVSRGYGSKAPHYPYIVNDSSTAIQAGDEPLLIDIRTKVPVVISPNRPEAVKKLLENFPCDVIISDDGLQHYALARDIEIIVVDSQRKFGNKLLFPAGPLREPISRLRQANFVLCHGEKLYKNSYSMRFKPMQLRQLKTNEVVKSQEIFKGKQIIAIAGIGNPERFFQTLSNLKLNFKKQAMPDHYAYRKEDFPHSESVIYIMTEKDAVKCKAFDSDNMFYLPIYAELETGFCQSFLNCLGKLFQQSK